MGVNVVSSRGVQGCRRIRKIASEQGLCDVPRYAWIGLRSMACKRFVGSIPIASTGKSQVRGGADGPDQRAEGPAWEQ